MSAFLNRFNTAADTGAVPVPAVRALRAADAELAEPLPPPPTAAQVLKLRSAAAAKIETARRQHAADLEAAQPLADAAEVECIKAEAAATAARATWESAKRAIALANFTHSRDVGAAERVLAETAGEVIETEIRKLNRWWDSARNSPPPVWSWEEVTNPDGSITRKPHTWVADTVKCCDSLRAAIRDTEALRFELLTDDEIASRIADIELRIKWSPGCRAAVRNDDQARTAP